MAELLAPAGNIEALDAAIGEGADAVYLGLKSFNARLRSANFAWNQFEAAVQSLHRMGKKIFVTVNTVIEERETERLYRFLAYLDAVGPDGLIVQDFGVVRMVQEFFPRLRLHASTQMNTASLRAVNLLGKQGIKRVVLARELGLEEIKRIRANTTAELEVFVHGALCVSESGLCLFSSYLGGKSANRGMCTQACRRFYTADEESGVEPGYYFSPCDLQLIDKIPELVTAGVDSFKIEGRMKSAEYVGAVTAAYRYMLDNWQHDRKAALAAAKRILSTDFARSKTTFWYGFDSPDDAQRGTVEGSEQIAERILNPAQAGGTGIYLGKIERTRSAKNGLVFALLSGKNYEPDPGDSIRLHRKDDSGRESHKVRFTEESEHGRWIDIPSGFSVGDEVYLLQTKSMSKRYRHVLPQDLSSFRRQPGARELPVLDLTPLHKHTLEHFPAGLYIQVSTVADLFTAQSSQPVRIILELNAETEQDLLVRQVQLPVSKKQIIISLDPYCSQPTEDHLADVLPMLIESGFKVFIVNNMAHIALLKGSGAHCIAGPYLYTFNRWAVSLLENQNIDAFAAPLENSRQNLEAAFEEKQRARVLVTLFAYPALFRMRFKLPQKYRFTLFSDKQDTVFKALSTTNGSFVIPDKPFSIIDKEPFIRAAGFSRFLLDFSKVSLQKNQLKQILNALHKHIPLSDTTRFNWKDGFYTAEQQDVHRQPAPPAAAAAGKQPRRAANKRQRADPPQSGKTERRAGRSERRKR